MPGDDAELVGRCLSGDTEAFGRLVKKYERAVYAIAYYYAGKYGSAEDIAQDTFLAAYRSLPRLRDPAIFGPWLKEISCRTASNWLRRHGRRIRSETPLPYRRANHRADGTAGPGESVERGEWFEMVEAAIDRLPEHYRLPVALRYIEELSYEEIAGFLGFSREEVRGILQRATRQLREIIEELQGGSESEEDQPWRPVWK